MRGAKPSILASEKKQDNLNRKIDQEKAHKQTPYLAEKGLLDEDNSGDEIGDEIKKIQATLQAKPDAKRIDEQRAISAGVIKRPGAKRAAA